MTQSSPEKYTREWFIEQGRIGGNKTKELYGLKHFEKIRKKGEKSKKAAKQLIK